MPDDLTELDALIARPDPRSSWHTRTLSPTRSGERQGLVRLSSAVQNASAGGSV